LNELRYLDLLEEKRALCDKEKLMKTYQKEKLMNAKVISDLERYALMEQVSSRQKSRELWLRDGDKCRKFFHQMANSNRRNKSIESLMVNCIVSIDHSEIREHIVQDYKSLYTKQFSWQPKLNGISFDSIAEVEANWLKRAFEEGEVFEVVKALNSDKPQTLIVFLSRSSKLVGMF
jgi:hypothetical protein